ncbi:MAG: hypothetical protein AAFV53_28640 [Myxococcota bacterium]
MPNLLREVLHFARLYRWTEEDVFRLSLRRRRAYLAIHEQEQDARLRAALLNQANR